MLATGCAMTPPAEDPVLIKLEEIDRRLSAVERVLASGSLIDLTVQVDRMQRESAEMRGRTESLEHESELTAGRQRDLYVDLDERIRILEESVQSASSTVSVMDGGSLAPGQLPVPGGSDRDNYQAAFELLKQQRYEPAALAFQQFLVSFPDSQLADNAQYWLAESYYVTDQFDEALAQFSIVINQYSDSRKVPDALLKMGYCNYELERWNDSRAALTRVQSEYPDTTAARLAAQRLNRMTEEGQ
jgi:tol-pal system protein YbgF